MRNKNKVFINRGVIFVNGEPKLKGRAVEEAKYIANEVRMNRHIRLTKSRTHKTKSWSSPFFHKV